MKSLSMLAVLGVALYNALAVLAVGLNTDPYRASQTMANILDLENGTQGLRYPTDLTRNLVPKFLHSHNDYWRDIPFYSALSVGAVSVEADVWLVNGTLYVGHERSALTPARTFDALYVQPILRELKRMNPITQFSPSPTKNGLFDTDSTQTLYLWVDVKTDGPSTFPAVVAALAPLRAAGYLTTFTAASGTAPAPVTVIGTGNTPLSQVQGVSPRDYFYDAPLPLLATSFANITRDVSPIASTDFAAAVGALPNGTIPADALARVNAQVAAAKAKGIGARYWDTPGWPLSARNRVWAQLWAAGVMLVNVDDLVAGAGYADGANTWG